MRELGHRHHDRGRALGDAERPMSAGDTEMRGRLLDAAEQVFYARGIQAVNMGELRSAADLPLKRIYQLFPGKDEMVELGPTNPAVVHHHQRAFRQLVTGVVTGSGCPPEVASAVYLLVEGAVATAGVQHSPAPAGEGRRGAEMLLAVTTGHG